MKKLLGKLFRLYISRATVYLFPSTKNCNLY